MPTQLFVIERPPEADKISPRLLGKLLYKFLPKFEFVVFEIKKVDVIKLLKTEYKYSK